MSTILIVEDDQNFRDLISEWLTLEKHTVMSCATGTEALQRLKALAFDVVILDWNLPDMLGLDILKEFRSSNAETPVIMLTGSSDRSDKERAIDAGASDFVQKPFKLSAFSDRMTALIAGK
jgi:DNA-binding response OmpR family regulator